jgi:hypothetical protein
LLGGFTKFCALLNNEQAKAETSAANMKRAERFTLSNHGPPMTADDEQEAKRRKLQSAAKKLEISFGFDDCKVVPSLDLLKPVTTNDLAELPKMYWDFELNNSDIYLRSGPVIMIDSRPHAVIEDTTRQLRVESAVGEFKARCNKMLVKIAGLPGHSCTRFRRSRFFTMR